MAVAYFICCSRCFRVSGRNSSLSAVCNTIFLNRLRSYFVYQRQDPEMAFLPSRGLCCCEGFEPQPPKRLKMRRFIRGCRFTRADARVREAIEPLIKTSTFRLPVEAKIIPSPRPSLLHEKAATANLCKIRCVLQRFLSVCCFFLSSGANSPESPKLTRVRAPDRARAAGCVPMTVRQK